LYRRELTNRLIPGPAYSEPFYQAVLAALPQRTRVPFDQLPRRDKVERFLTWMRQYAASLGEVSQQDLERFFAEELDVRTRAALLSLPPGEMEQALRWHYRQRALARRTAAARTGWAAGRLRPAAVRAATRSAAEATAGGRAGGISGPRPRWARPAGTAGRG
jgi:hypothetical protein